MLLDTLAHVGVGVGSDTLSAGDIGSTQKHPSFFPVSVQCSDLSPEIGRDLIVAFLH